ncbi:type II toxin-antitoxin system PemK/MazF family toxin [Marinomonas communis]|uniref:PemK-like, MazF-like toxin of type II toxin-antitoxin system n=1 Tax=Marinomonas communis TaxID=28254 RepID=A0A4R6X0W6_9GAMM|nr:type II toxin-antitoxin system PemK/MazF family toxin [Marinomonas communis]TDR12485.1 PemK-like, MazF-like toxin of type II toxin-antitoxin system [Marinomonas communis]
MKLIYRNSNVDNETLGSLQHDNIERILVPSSSQDGHDVYLKQSFSSSKETVLWRVRSVNLVDDAVIYVDLEESNDACASVADFASSQSKSVEFYLKEFQIVEVDFGFHSKLHRSDGSSEKNSFFNNALMPGEMHKRRPCITLKAKGGRVQVIPLSTRVPSSGDRLSIPISAESFSKLATRYSSKKSYALLNMIQTVSAHRVHPPRAANLKFEHKYHLYKLNAEDKQRLKDSLGAQYTDWLLTEKNTIENRAKQLAQEKSKLLSNMERLKCDVSSANEKISFLENMLLKFGGDLGAGDTLDEVISYIQGDPGTLTD